MKAQKKEIPFKPYVSMELLTTLTQVLYREARLLDQERYDEWMNLMAEDLHYHMPGIETRYRRDKYDQVADLNRMAYYDDSKGELKKRLARLETGTAWSEDPQNLQATNNKPLNTENGKRNLSIDFIDCFIYFKISQT